MPDTRTRRGPHPKDEDCFSPAERPRLDRAVADLSWLRSRGYSQRAATILVGDRYRLRDRQRKAIQRGAASEHACERRQASEQPAAAIAGETVHVDGYNVLLTLESALSDAILFRGRDGALRDLAAMRRHYRRLDVTAPAVDLIAEYLDAHRCAEVLWLLDRPVSNSGRLRRLISDRVAGRNARWSVELTEATDHILAASPHLVATADSAILDRCERWINLAFQVVTKSVAAPRILDWSRGSATPTPSPR